MDWSCSRINFLRSYSSSLDPCIIALCSMSTAPRAILRAGVAGELYPSPKRSLRAAVCEISDHITGISFQRDPVAPDGDILSGISPNTLPPVAPPARTESAFDNVCRTFSFSILRVSYADMAHLGFSVSNRPHTDAHPSCSCPLSGFGWQRAQTKSPSGRVHHSAFVPWT